MELGKSLFEPLKYSRNVFRNKDWEEWYSRDSLIAQGEDGGLQAISLSLCCHAQRLKYKQRLECGADIQRAQDYHPAQMRASGDNQGLGREWDQSIFTRAAPCLTLTCSACVAVKRWGEGTHTSLWWVYTLSNRASGAIHFTGRRPCGNTTAVTAQPAQETRPRQTRPRQTRPRQARPDKTWPEKTWPDQARPGQTRPGTEIQGSEVVCVCQWRLGSRWRLTLVVFL